MYVHDIRASIVVSGLASVGLVAVCGGCGEPPRSRMARVARPVARTASPVVRPRPLAAPLPRRGAILDRRGRVLAAHAVRYNVYAVPRDVDVAGLEAVRLALDLKSGWLHAARGRLGKVEARLRGRAMLIVAGLTPVQWRRGKERLRRIRGVWVHPVLSRKYPLGSLASHVLGHLGEVSPAELKRGYRIRDRVGRFGVERLYERTLRGLFHGRAKPSTPGRRVVLTLDADLQRLVEKALVPHPMAAAVAVDIHTGQILAMASRPGLDLRRLAAPMSSEGLANLVSHPFKPFWDRAVMAAVNPGTTFLVVSALAALRSRAPRIPRTIRCTGGVYHQRRRYRCIARHGALSAQGALARGCRSWFYRAGGRLGLDRLASTARSLGLGQTTGLDLNDEVGGTVPTVAWLKSVAKLLPHPGHVMTAVIGQGQVTVTPLQLAVVYAAIANGGRLYRPQLALRTERPDGRPFRRFKPRLRRQIKIGASTLRTIRRGLRQAVAHAKGQARGARVAGVAVAGLAGSGQGGAHGYRRPNASSHAWFAGYAPAQRPEIAVVVLLQNGGSGNRVAAPIAGRILCGYFSLKRTKPQIASHRR